MTAPDYAWQNGRLVRWDDCVVHARSQGAFWGANVFEGIRAYAGPETMHAFRVDDHLARLRRSMKSLHLEIGHSDAELKQACLDVVQANGFNTDTHICVVAYFDEGPNFDPLAYTTSTGVHITAIPMPRSAKHETGAAASIASWRRISDDSMPPRIKTGANYHNSRLAQHEAVRNGYDTTLLLNQRGTVAEAPGSCVVMVRDGELVTPPGTSGVLEGITVATVARLAEEKLGIPLRRREIDRTELYVADEIFLCGTLAELLPVTSVDRNPVGDGKRGPLTAALQSHYDDAVRARGDHPEWCTPIAPAREEVTA
ncbi:branched-chain-amino-acid transaminase [Kutzneria kofuensis]|uniref:Branched-chain-amino-acid aminotransferase n=1 Tax=Kutzneria kofuensis TaxID=103725 RepID=A0A7W9NL76_9PSEU|nr:branched-chain-amino-acid transaminase [Kutzneria kofuensis]MBB5896018.1 branched-chain amino acid aminotransferase [Kutzneria kofuensis]